MCYVHTYIHTYTHTGHVCMYVCMHVYFLAWPTEKVWKKQILIALPSTQILASKCPSLLKGSPERKGWFQGPGTESTRLAWNISLWQKARNCSENNGDIFFFFKRHRNQVEKAPTGQTWDNLCIKIIIITHLIRNHESTHTNKWISKLEVW